MTINTMVFALEGYFVALEALKFLSYKIWKG